MPYTDAINKRRRCAMSTEEAKRRAKKKFIAEKLEGMRRKLIEKNNQGGKVYGRKLTSINYPGLNYSISCSRNTVARMASR